MPGLQPQLLWTRRAQLALDQRKRQPSGRSVSCSHPWGTPRAAWPRSLPRGAWPRSASRRPEYVLGQAEAARGVLPSTGDPDLTGEFWSAAAEHAIWASRLSDARAAVDAGLMALGSASDRLPSCQLLALGLRIEAEWADRARMGRLGSEMLEVRELADVRRAELEALVAGFIDRRASAPRELNAFPALGRAEHSRVLGHP